MGGILALALAAAVYPQLLAVVVVILTRPNPRPLLWGCYLSSVVIGLAASAAVLVVTVVVFILIKFLAIEVPIVSYALRPRGHGGRGRAVRGLDAGK
jgi:hypothetical protein